MTSMSARLTLLAALAAPLLGACAHALPTALDIKRAEGDNPGTVLYAVDEAQFETPGDFRAVNGHGYLELEGSGDCAKTRAWGRPNSVNTTGQGSAFQTNCASVTAGPLPEFTTEACRDPERLGFYFPYLVSSPSFERSKVELAGIETWQFFGRFSAERPGDYYLYVTCAARPWLFTVWVPRDDVATGGRAHGLFLRTIRFEPRTVAAK